MRVRVGALAWATGLVFVITVAVACGQRTENASPKARSDSRVSGEISEKVTFATYATAYEYYRRVVTEESANAVLKELRDEITSDLEAFE